MTGWRARECGVGLATAAVLLGACASAAAADRAFELVSPPGNDALIRVAGGPSTPDGNTVCYSAEEPLAGSDPGGNVLHLDGFCANRGSAGWSTEWITKPGGTPRPGGSLISHITDDGSRALWVTENLIDDLSYPSINTYRSEAGAATWVSPELSPEDPLASEGRRPLATTPDLSRVLFATTSALAGANDTNGTADYYAHTPAGVRLVSRDASGQAVGVAASGVQCGGNTDEAMTHGHPASLSADGTKAFFQTRAMPGGPTQPNVYRVDIDGGSVIDVSPRTEAVGAVRPVGFAGASEGGSVVYLCTAQQLTAEPKLGNTFNGWAIYRYTVADADLELVATHASGAWPLAVSSDGSTLVYRAGMTLRVLHNDQDVEIGPLHASDTTENQRVASVRNTRALRVSPDGRTAVFVSAGDLGHGAVPGVAQVWRWRAGEGLVRVSASATGDQPSEAASIGSYSVEAATPRYGTDILLQYRNMGRVATNDGNTVYFDTTQSLVPEDSNGQSDVYEWRSGQPVRLVSPGTSPHPAYYVDNSADGSTVFFATYEPILPALDTNPGVDIYAARVGGGFPDPAPSTVGSDAPGATPAATGTPSPPPTVEPSPFEPPAPPTGALTPGESSPPAAGERARITDVSARARVRRRVAVPVEVSEPGVVAVRITTRRGATIGRARDVADEAGAATATVKLKRGPWRRLQRHGRLPVRVVARFTPADGGLRAREVERVTLRLAGRRGDR